MFKTLLILSLIQSTHAILSLFGVHKCEQGHSCVYYRGGKLLDDICPPGYHMKLPLLTSHYNIQTTWQTDKLFDVVCGSSRGGQAYLDIEVVNKLNNDHNCIRKVVGEHTIDYDKSLIFDYIPSEVAQFCKNYTLDDIVIREFDKLDEVLLEKLRHNIESYNLESCIDIKKVRINRPKLDKAMQMKFQSIEDEQKTKELEVQRKETERVKLEIITQKEVMEKERQMKTTKIEMDIQISTAKSKADKQKIIDNMILQTKKTEADSEKYKLERIAEGNNLLFQNPNYIKLKAYESAHNNAKLIFGDVPQNAFMNLGGFTSFNNIVQNSSF